MTGQWREHPDDPAIAGMLPPVHQTAELPGRRGRHAADPAPMRVWDGLLRGVADHPFAVTVTVVALLASGLGVAALLTSTPAPRAAAQPEVSRHRPSVQRPIVPRATTRAPKQTRTPRKRPARVAPVKPPVHPAAARPTPTPTPSTSPPTTPSPTPTTSPPPTSTPSAPPTRPTPSTAVPPTKGRR